MPASDLTTLAGVEGLVADIGGTNCRLALAVAGEPALRAITSRPNADFGSALDAIRAYLDAHAGGAKIGWAVLAAAGPVQKNAVDLTNNTPWRIDGAEIAHALALPVVRICNDLTAVAAAVPSLKPDDLSPIGRKAELKLGAPIAVVGVGTGLGVSGVVTGEAEMVLLSGEGGHTTFAPTDPLQRQIARILEPRFGRLSNERVLSGDGLHLLYLALCQIEGVAPVADSPRAVTEGARDRADPMCIRALTVFSHALGAFCGDLVLTLGGGGLCLAGGTLKGLQDLFDEKAFRQGFEDKGRFGDDLQPIPSWHVRHPQPALLGAAMMAASLTDSPNVFRRR